MQIVLHQFAFSHFNEKARWALDFKGLSHQRRTYLPGPHRPQIKRLSGQSATPVLTLADETIAGSAAIIDALEQRYPQPALYPLDAGLRSEALQLQARYDRDVGPATRTVLFSALVHEPDYFCAMFTRGKGFLSRAGYRATFPLARNLIARANGVTEPDNVTACFHTARQALDEIATMSAATGYMVGESFSVADLTAAALFAPLADVTHPDMARPKPMPASVTAIIEQFAAHPAVRWVNEIYQRYR